MEVLAREVSAFHSRKHSEAPERQKAADQRAVKVFEREEANGAPAMSAAAALKVQKIYRGYRTRRMLADSAVLAEELWWQALDFARLSYSTISFYNFSKPEAAASRWNRVSANASRVGQGLSKDEKAQMLAFQHWIEAIDPRHRYGHNLHFYYDEWCKSQAGQPFFHWLDIGDGKWVDLKECPRSKLRQQCIKYLGPRERERYEYVVVDGKILHKLIREPLDTNEGSPRSKWIFVTSASKRLYIGEKKKGSFHHSSFLAGGAALAAGRLKVDDGVLKSISAYSGHYKPTDDRLQCFLSFLSENGVNLEEVEVQKATHEDYEVSENGKGNENGKLTLSVSIPELSAVSDSVSHGLPCKDLYSETTEASLPKTKPKYNRTLSGGLQSLKANVSKKAILQRMNSKEAAKSYQLGHQLSSKWSTGAGPRIGCIADYPAELREQALRLISLYPRTSPPTPTPGRFAALVSASSCPPNIGYNGTTSCQASNQ